MQENCAAVGTAGADRRGAEGRRFNLTNIKNRGSGARHCGACDPGIAPDRCDAGGH